MYIYVSALCPPPFLLRQVVSVVCLVSCLSCWWFGGRVVSVNENVDKRAVASHGGAEKDHVYCKYDGKDYEDDYCDYGADGPD